MKKVLTALWAVGVSAMVATSAMANNAKANSTADNAIKQQLSRQGINHVEIQPSPLAGIKTVIADQGIFYISENGQYVLQGNIYQLTDHGAVDIAHAYLLKKVAEYEPQMIVYPAVAEKYVVTVFMDISCHYCRLLHQQVKAYNDLGITLRYLAFPRAGATGQTASQMEAIWQAKDPAFAFNQAEQGEMPKNLLKPAMVKKHYELGLQFGVKGTPSIILPNGELIGGYLAPQALLEALQQ